MRDPRCCSAALVGGRAGGCRPAAVVLFRQPARPPARPPARLTFAVLPHCAPARADPEGLRPLKFLATRFHMAFSAMICLGLLISTLM